MPGVKSGSSREGPQRELVRVKGRLEREVVRRGTASEHDSWVLVSKTHGQLLLKRLGANPFELGSAPAEPGCEVEAEGYLLSGELRYTSVRKL
jgi:hypothetical protein